MIKITYVVTLVIALVLGSAPAAGEPANAKSETAATLAQSALLGMQLSIKRGHQAGKVPDAVASCVAALNTDSFLAVFEALVKKEFNTTEQGVADQFFKSPVGIKYTKYGLLRIYTAVGEKTPEPLPSFSDAEMKQIEEFSKTSAGNKLMAKNAMQGPEATKAVSGRVNELLSQCDKGK